MDGIPSVALSSLHRCPVFTRGVPLAWGKNLVMSFFRVGQAASILCHALFWAVSWPASRAMNHAI